MLPKVSLDKMSSPTAQVHRFSLCHLGVIFHLHHSSFLPSFFFFPSQLFVHSDKTWRCGRKEHLVIMLSFICIYHSVDLSSPLSHKEVKQRRATGCMWQWIRSQTFHLLTHIAIALLSGLYKWIVHPTLPFRQKALIQTPRFFILNWATKNLFLSTITKKNTNQSWLQDIQGKLKLRTLLGKSM